MATMTAGTKYGTEYAGNYREVTVLVDAGTQSGTVQFNSLSTIRGGHITLAEAPTADAALVSILGTDGGNIVTVAEYTPQGTLNTQTAIDFYLTVIGEY